MTTRRFPALIVILVMILCLPAMPAQALTPWVEAMPPRAAPLAQGAAGDPLPRIVCPADYEAFVYAAGLYSPNGLAFDPNGVLYVTEELPGRVSRIDPGGRITPVIVDLTRPEGLTFDPEGNLYVVEDVQNGRLLRVNPSGNQTVLATGLDAPEDVLWSPDAHLYITESNVQFAENAPWDVVTGITRISQGGDVTHVLTDTMLWSYSALALGADDLLYVANEASNVVTTDSIFRLDPATGAYTLFASELTTPEGLSFSPGGAFPLFVTEEDLGDERGRLSMVRSDGSHMPLCTGFSMLEDISVDAGGNLYISEDTNGLVIKIVPPDLTPPASPLNPAADPPDWTATNAFTLTWENPLDMSGITGAYLKLGDPPAFITDGTFYAGTDLTHIAGITVTGPGVHPAHLWLEDGLGNADPLNSVTASLRYDPEPPAKPLRLAVDPPDWSATNSFALTWVNPPELSGVMAACYRLDTPGMDETPPEACVVGVDIHTLSDLSVAGSGEYQAHIWLADAVGNIDPTAAVSTSLRHDALPPASVASAPPAVQTAPIQVTWTATDTHSGVETVALWVRTDDGTPWTDTGLSSPANGPGFFLYQPVGEGLYSFATLAVDRAGNAEVGPTGEGDTQTLCQTWQRVYLPLLWKDGP